MKKKLLLIAAMLFSIASPTLAEPFIGEVKMFAGNFAPRGWAKCEGQILPINRYQALFSLLGTTYGGDGRTTFALPDLRGKAPVHPSTRGRLGSKTNTAKVEISKIDPTKPKLTVDTVPVLRLNYIICLSGMFPSRN